MVVLGRQRRNGPGPDRWPSREVWGRNGSGKRCGVRSDAAVRSHAIPVIRVNTGRQDGLRARLEHIRRDGSGHTVQNAIQNAAEEAALRAGPGHSDPRRDELRREAHKGGTAPGCHRDRLLNRAGRASRVLVLLSPGQRTVPPSQTRDEPTTRGRKPKTVLRYRGIAVRLG
jgi:hypothetical protein